MRYIKKALEFPIELKDKHANPPQTKEEAKVRWNDKFKSTQKQRLTKILLAEQFHLCAYSELRAEKEGCGYHIDHIKPRFEYPGLTFDYYNLVVSALNSDPDLKNFKESNEQTFGGDAKGNTYDVRLFISCLQPNCARYFFYRRGRIEPAVDLTQAETAQAEYTIKILNLNCNYLVNLRKRKFEELENLYPLDSEAEVSSELRQNIYEELLPKDGKMESFFTLTRQFFGPVAEQVLRDHAPELL